MDKSNHTVTVPRDYLEKLELEHMLKTENKNNAHLSVRALYESKSFGIEKGYGNHRVLFIALDETFVLTKELAGIVIVDSEGREIARYKECLDDEE